MMFISWWDGDWDTGMWSLYKNIKRSDIKKLKRFLSLSNNYVTCDCDNCEPFDAVSCTIKNYLNKYNLVDDKLGCEKRFIKWIVDNA